MLNRIAKCGYRITMLGKNVRIERGVEVQVGRISKIYHDVFESKPTRTIRRLEREIDIKNEYIKGLEEILYSRFTSNKQSSNDNQK